MKNLKPWYKKLWNCLKRFFICLGKISGFCAMETKAAEKPNWDELSYKNERRRNLFLLIAALFSALLAWDAVISRVMINHADHQTQVYRQWMSKIDGSIVDLRTFYRKQRYLYQHGVKISNEQFTKRRFSLINNIVKANSGTRNVLGDDTDKSVYLLNMFDETVKNIYSSISPHNEAWQSYLLSINYIIGLKIKLEEEREIHYRTFLLFRPFVDLKNWLH